MWEDLELRELQTKHKMQNGLTSVDHLGPTRGGPSPLLGLFGAHWNGSCRAESAVLFVLKGCCFWPTEQKFPPQPWHALAQTHTYTHITDTGGCFANCVLSKALRSGVVKWREASLAERLKRTIMRRARAVQCSVLWATGPHRCITESLSCETEKRPKGWQSSQCRTSAVKVQSPLTN